ncbi:MAG: hypothetical protein VX208_01260 [SAR324 cluster bacterium]|nr:hypothetical protein [SAR324 cluster bacterium]
MKHGHLTEQRKHFVEAYCRLGNGTLAAKEAGYKDSPSLVNQASKLKRELSSEIAEELTANFMSAAPKALSILMDLAENSASDSVKFQASKDLLDRAGFRPVDRREEIRPQHTPEELEAEIKRLVGSEKAELLLGKKSVDDLVQEKLSRQEKKSFVN